MRTDDFEFLTVQQHSDGVVVATMGHADRENKFSPTERDEFPRIVGRANEDPEVRVIVLTGEGDVFCGGADHSRDPFEPYAYYDRSRRFIMSFIDNDIPFVVAMNGPASGLGLTIALTADILIAERQVEFRDSHVAGGVAAATGPYLWPLSTGLARAKASLLTARRFSAQQAYDWGLISEVVGRGQSMKAAMEYASEMAVLRPETLRATKRNLNQWYRLASRDVLQHGLSTEFMTFPGDYAAQTRQDGVEQP